MQELPEIAVQGGKPVFVEEKTGVHEKTSTPALQQVFNNYTNWLNHLVLSLLNVTVASSLLIIRLSEYP